MRASKRPPASPLAKSPSPPYFYRHGTTLCPTCARVALLALLLCCLQLTRVHTITEDAGGRLWLGIREFHQRRKAALMDRIGITSGKQLVFYKASDIVCIRTGEKGKGKVEIVLESGRDTANITLKSLLPELPATFRQINRFTVVNLDWVSAVDLSNGEVRRGKGIGRGW